MPFLTYLKYHSWQPTVKANAPLAFPAPPDTNVEAEQMARAAQTERALARKRAAAGTNRTSTMLTGAQGTTTAAPTQRKTLLGM